MKAEAHFKHHFVTVCSSIMHAASRLITIAGLLLLLILLLQGAPAAMCQPPKVDEPISYEHYHADDNVRANPCKVVHNVTAPAVGAVAGTGYIPFVGTSIAHDSQLLLLRLYNSLRDFPVEQFIVLVPERALDPPQGAIWYQLQHLKEYGDNVMIIACRHAASVADGWNAGDHVHSINNIKDPH
jgi:hypothetical protein